MKVVIFCGGRGTRLWPISRVSKPKPFIRLVNNKSFFEITYERFRKVFAPDEIFVSTEEPYVSLVKSQAPAIPSKNIIAEPERKDLLAACGLATAVVSRFYPGESMLISWAKHTINRESVFLDAVKAAGTYADKTGYIVSVDTKPTIPSVYNGWVRLGATLATVDGFEIQQIKEHKEKPNERQAKKLFKSGKWLINTGYRVWKSDTMLGYYKKLHPQMYEGLMKISAAWGTPKQEKVLKSEYGKFEKDSVEYGIFEKLPGDVRATIAADMGWEDTSMSWGWFYESLATAKQKTVIEGGARYQEVDSKNNLVFAPKNKMVGIVGLSDIAVIDTKDGLLVCDLKNTQKVKDLYAKLERYFPKYVK